MAELNYTKGDWKVGYYLVYSGEPNFPILVCNTDVGIVSESEKTANAHLIAASPSMYKALREAQNYLSFNRLDRAGSSGFWVVDEINKALAKAEGKE